MGWAKICSPLENGGLGLTSIPEIASCALRKQAWHVACRRKSILVVWACKKYIKRNSFWDLKHPSNCSWGWRGILSVRAEILSLVHHLISNGNSTFFCLDPWLDRGPLIDKFGESHLRFGSRKEYLGQHFRC